MYNYICPTLPQTTFHFLHELYAGIYMKKNHYFNNDAVFFPNLHNYVPISFLLG